jgi:starch-binding outer membrane protein, SusD/RagB family
MRFINRSIVLLAVAGGLTACADDHLTTQPQTILTDEQVWTDPNMIRGAIADFYGRLPQYMSFGGQTEVEAFAAYDEALWSGIITLGGTVNRNPNLLAGYPYDRWNLWDGTPAGSSWGLIRDLNLAIDQIGKASTPQLNPVKPALLAELRFQRAWAYFEKVKRMGGVPITTEPQIYDFRGDPSYLQTPRATEAEVYEFVANEVDAIVSQLANGGSKSRANRFTALALKSRAMLYAGSLATHNNEMPSPIRTAGGEVGIPAGKAVEYYTKSLEASRAIINSGVCSPFFGTPHRGQNFADAYQMKSGNPEVIWARDYSVAAGRTHLQTMHIVPRSMRIDIDGAALSPTLQLVEAFDYLNGSPGTLPGVGDGTVGGQANWIFYDNLNDIFETVNGGKDWRLFGTVIYPGSNARGQPIDFQAGVYVWNADANRYDKVEGQRGSTFTDGLKLTGADGPRIGESYLGNTGFHVRKLLDPAPAAATQATGSEMWWVFFRLGEIYLNAAEAAFELGLHAEALGYVNTLRQRAGFPANSLSALTRARIRNERRVELAFEDHRLWDLKRWRIAHELWDGTASSTTANAWVLFPYRIVRPGHPHHNKYVFDKFKAPHQTNPRYFQMGNYYGQIPSAALGNNPRLVPNPFH